MQKIIDKHLILYILIGVWGAVVDFGSFYVLNTIIGTHYIVANTAASSLGILNNFVCNYKFNFKVNDHFFKRCAIFFTIGLSGIILSNFIMFILVEYCDFNSIFSKGLALCIVVAAQYTVNRVVTFKTNM